MGHHLKIGQVGRAFNAPIGKLAEVSFVFIVDKGMKDLEYKKGTKHDLGLRRGPQSSAD